MVVQHAQGLQGRQVLNEGPLKGPLQRRPVSRALCSGGLPQGPFAAEAFLKGPLSGGRPQGPFAAQASLKGPPQQRRAWQGAG